MEKIGMVVRALKRLMRFLGYAVVSLDDRRLEHERLSLLTVSLDRANETIGAQASEIHVLKMKNPKVAEELMQLGRGGDLPEIKNRQLKEVNVRLRHNLGELILCVEDVARRKTNEVTVDMLNQLDAEVQRVRHEAQLTGKIGKGKQTYGQFMVTDAELEEEG
jgi:hypothetical protein